MVDGLINSRPLPATVFVIFETGCAPMRGQIRIDIPIIISKVSYIGAAFPTLQPQDNYLPNLTVLAESGKSWNTALVSDMDSVIGLDFKNEMPIVITKTIAALPWSRGWPLTPQTRRSGSKMTWRDCSCKSAPPSIKRPSTSRTTAPGQRSRNSFRSAIFRCRPIEQLN